MNDSPPAVLSDQVVVDLSHLTSPEQFAAIGRIEDVVLVIVPESLAAAYLAIPASDVVSTLYVPDGAKVRMHTGVLQVPGDGIGAENDVLIVTGALVVTSAVTGPLPHQILVTGMVLAPRGSEQALGTALANVTGAVTYYRYTEGQDFRVLSGEVKVSAAMLENRGGQPDDVFLGAGAVLITGRPDAIGYGLAIVAGAVAAPEASREVIEPRLQTVGQIAWYPGDNVRAFHTETSLGAGFFHQLAEPTTLVSFAELTILPDVTESLLREKVRSFTLFKRATVPAELVGLVQFLATDAFGPIEADDGPSGDEPGAEQGDGLRS